LILAIPDFLKLQHKIKWHDCCMKLRECGMGFWLFGKHKQQKKTGNSLNMINKALVSASLFAGLLTAGAAQAVVVVGLTQSQTLNFAPNAAGLSQSLNVNQFNQGVLGTGTRYLLTGVQIKYSLVTVAPLSTVTITSNSGNRRLLIDTVSATNTLSSSTFTSFNRTISGVSDVADFETGIAPGGANGLVRTVGISYTPASAFAPPTIVNVAPFIGSGTFAVTSAISNLANNITTTVGGAGNATFTAGTYKGTFEIIYTFNDLLPEPGTWATFILGFGAVGAAMRRRRRALA
jgi:hypothetical protein